MNEHDSERMEGMLDSLGYAARRRRATSADVILFNTCSIRESADNRFIGHLGEAKRLKKREPRARRRRRRLLVAVAQGRGVRALPVRRRRLRARQIPKLAEFLRPTSLTAQGYFEFEGFSGHLPMRREREFQAWVQISLGCNCVLRLLHRAVDARARGEPAAAELVAEAEALAADGVARSRCSART